MQNNINKWNPFTIKKIVIYFLMTSILYEKPKASQVAEIYKVQCSPNKKNTWSSLKMK